MPDVKRTKQGNEKRPPEEQSKSVESSASEREEREYLDEQDSAQPRTPDSSKEGEQG